MLVQGAGAVALFALQFAKLLGAHVFTDRRGHDHIVELAGERSLPQSLRAIRPSGTISLIGVLPGGAMNAARGDGRQRCTGAARRCTLWRRGKSHRRIRRPTMSQFVLVHGAWHGGWCWRRVLPRLRAAGHGAYPVTLTGCGERAHLLGASIRLQTHIDDVLGVIDCEELSEVVLVGHSYSGIVITGAADWLLQRPVSPLSQLVYVDAVTPHPGESWSSQHPPETIAAREQAARESGGIALPPPDAAVFGLAGDDRDWVNRRQTPQPFGVYHDRLAFDAARVGRVPRTFIDCTDPALATIAAMRARVRREPGWRVEELPTGHDPMISAPEALAELLLRCTG